MKTLYSQSLLAHELKFPVKKKLDFSRLQNFVPHLRLLHGENVVW